jgi:uncharacterized protein YoxC
MAQHVEAFAGMLLNMQALMQHQVRMLHQVNTSVNHLGMGVDAVVQQQQQLSGQQQLTVELQRKTLQTLDGLVAGQVSVHESIQGMRQQLGDVQHDVAAAATTQAHGNAGSKAGQLGRAHKPLHTSKARASCGGRKATVPAAAAAAADATTTDGTVQRMWDEWPGECRLLSGVSVPGHGAVGKHGSSSSG